MFSEAWGAVTRGDNSFASMASFIISRSDRWSFTQSCGQLQACVNEMISPVVTA